VSEVETACGETVWAETKVAEANTKKIAPRIVSTSLGKVL
jgi:hypothetical protein